MKRFSVAIGATHTIGPSVLTFHAHRNICCCDQRFSIIVACGASIPNYLCIPHLRLSTGRKFNLWVKIRHIFYHFCVNSKNFRIYSVLCWISEFSFCGYIHNLFACLLRSNVLEQGGLLVTLCTRTKYYEINYILSYLVWTFLRQISFFETSLLFHCLSCVYVMSIHSEIPNWNNDMQKRNIDIVDPDTSFPLNNWILSISTPNHFL